jgi:superfamily II DNA or RNA helicase
VEAPEDGESQQTGHGSGTGLGTGQDGSSREFRLRPYQGEARDAAIAEWEKGTLATLLTAAPGTGKTEVGLAILETEWLRCRLDRALWLGHRTELIAQPRDRIRRHFPLLDSLPVGIVEAEQDDCGAQIVIATVQTASQEARLARLLDGIAFTHLVIDEAHHGVAETYLRVVHRLRARNPALRILGLTATPRGGSGARGLGDLFQSVAFSFTLRKAIRAGVLAPFEANAVELPVSFRDVHVSHGDYQQEQAGAVLSHPQALAVIVKAWRQYAEGRPTLAFTASVQQAHALAATFQNAGIAAAAVDGNTPRDERADIVDRFTRGHVPVLCNCLVFTEGVDLPLASCMVQARPTPSDALYAQMLGRILRLAPGKTSALVLDFVPKDSRDLYTSADLRETRPQPAAAADGRVARSFAVTADGEEIDGTPEELHLRVLEYLERDPLAWRFDGQFATTTISAGRTAAVVALDSSRYALYVVERGADGEPSMARRLREMDAWEDAVEATRQLVAAKDQILADRTAPWRRHPASEKQIAQLRRMGLWTPGMTKGEAAERMTHEFARRAILRPPRDIVPPPPLGRSGSATTRAPSGAYVMRAPCPGCGTWTGVLQDRNGQATVRCAHCGRFCYNAPKSEARR